MKADDTVGIKVLKEKALCNRSRRCYGAVYGMPKMVAQAGLTNEILPITEIADTIIRNVGVQ